MIKRISVAQPRACFVMTSRNSGVINQRDLTHLFTVWSRYFVHSSEFLTFPPMKYQCLLSVSLQVYCSLIKSHAYGAKRYYMFIQSIDIAHFTETLSPTDPNGNESVLQAARHGATQGLIHVARSRRGRGEVPHYKLGTWD